MKYQIVNENDFLLIKVSGNTRKNEAVLSNAQLKPYLQGKGIKVIIDFKELGQFEPTTLLVVLNTLKKEIDFLRGSLMVCSLKPEMEGYMRKNRLDHIFYIFDDMEKAKQSIGS